MHHTLLATPTTVAASWMQMIWEEGVRVREGEGEGESEGGRE